MKVPIIQRNACAWSCMSCSHDGFVLIHHVQHFRNERRNQSILTGMDSVYFIHHCIKSIPLTISLVHSVCLPIFGKGPDYSRSCTLNHYMFIEVIRYLHDNKWFGNPIKLDYSAAYLAS